MNKQEIYTKVRTHLLEQDAKSYDDDAGVCMYRGPEGRKCAIGCLIPDDLYTTNIEGKGIDGLTPATKHFLGITDTLGGAEDNAMVDFLVQLQNLHDTTDPEYWTDALDEIASEWCLSVSA